MTGHIAPTGSSTSWCTAAALAQGPATACVMVEVTGAALLSGPILVRAAFASTGTNDLTPCGGARCPTSPPRSRRSPLRTAGVSPSSRSRPNIGRWARAVVHGQLLVLGELVL
ncbi:MAG TPA: hypothetical protein VIJ07_11385 [Dermatophilaceae bacterium]